MAITRELLGAIFNKLDINQDNFLSKDEFRVGYDRLQPEAPPGKFDKKWESISKGADYVTLEALALYWGITLGTDDLNTAGMGDDQIMEIMALRGMVTSIEEDRKRKEEEATAVKQAEAMLRKASVGGGSGPASRRNSRRGSRGEPVGGLVQRELTRRESKVVRLKTQSNVLQSEGQKEVAFLQAADVGEHDEVEALLKADVSVNVCDDRQETVLHKLCRIPPDDQTRWRELFTALLEKGLEIDYMDRRGKTAIFTAAEYGRPEILAWLVQKGADVNWLSNEYQTVLHQALVSNKPAVVRLLLSDRLRSKLEDINAIDAAGRTPLHIASFKADPEIVQLLLDAGADPLVEDNNKNSAARLAERTGRKNSAALLKHHQELAAQAAANTGHEVGPA
mmetsp:Transcript_15226/g.40874  ORF Transcript_15226/g.40874 Transcript_15226/m.40874 type:complete len:394 (-) Transcript_15226:220-1401(-)